MLVASVSFANNVEVKGCLLKVVNQEGSFANLDMIDLRKVSRISVEQNKDDFTIELYVSNSLERIFTYEGSTDSKSKYYKNTANLSKIIEATQTCMMK